MKFSFQSIAEQKKMKFWPDGNFPLYGISLLIFVLFTLFSTLKLFLSFFICTSHVVNRIPLKQPLSSRANVLMVWAGLWWKFDMQLLVHVKFGNSHNVKFWNCMLINYPFINLQKNFCPVLIFFSNTQENNLPMLQIESHTTTFLRLTHFHWTSSGKLEKFLVFCYKFSFLLITVERTNKTAF